MAVRSSQHTAVSREPSLLDLPPELWTTICKLTIDELTPDMLRLGTGLYKRVQQPAITRINRLLRTEMLPYFYASAFRITIAPRVWSHLGSKYMSSNAADLRAWLHLVGSETRRALRSVVLVADPIDLERGLLHDLQAQLGMAMELGEPARELSVSDAGKPVWMGHGRRLSGRECAYLVSFP